jgi:hypothetical protein
MRALPADSLEYFVATPVGNTALPAAGGAGASAFGLVVFSVVDVAAALDPHSSLRNWFYVFPFSVPAA